MVKTHSLSQNICFTELAWNIGRIMNHNISVQSKIGQVFGRSVTLLFVG